MNGIFISSTSLFLIILFVFPSLAAERQISDVLTITMISWAFLCIIASILIALNHIKIGTILMYIGAIPFVPLGIWPIVMTRNYRDTLKRKDFEEGITKSTL